MLRLNSELMVLFSDYGPIKRKTASGTEIVLRRCPLDLKNRGEKHPLFKCYLNGSKQKVKCFYCHRDGEGADLEDLISRRPRRANVEVLPEEPVESKLVPIPSSIAVADIKEGLHPAWLYLNKERRISFEAVRDSRLRWKNAGVPSWYKKNEDGHTVGTCKMPGLVIPVTVKDKLMGWQLCPVPRIKGFLKYISATGSSFPLYNFDHVARVKSKVCVVVEGVFDALTLHNISVGIFTDKINDRKKRILASGEFDEIILCLDSDRSDEHINKNLSRIVGCAPVVRSVKLVKGDPNDHDPAELVRILGLEGKDLFRQ